MGLEFQSPVNQFRILNFTYYVHYVLDCTFRHMLYRNSTSRVITGHFTGIKIL